MKRERRQDGSLSIEAAIVIVMFIFGYMAIVAVTDFIRAQMIIQQSITQAAKEISSYCYIASKTGLMEDSKRLGQEAGEAKKNMDDVIDTVAKLYETVENGSEHITNSIGSVPINDDLFAQLEAIQTAGGVAKEEYESMAAAAEKVMSESEDYFSRPDEILKGLASVAKDKTFSTVKSYALAAPISRALVKEQLDLYGKDRHGRDILENLGVVGGIKGLNFTGCTLFNDGMTIDVTVVYTMKVDIPFFDEKEFHFRQTASTRAWGAKND